MFGTKLQKARHALLDHLPAVNNAIFLGAGTGRLLEAFCRSNSNCDTTSVDISPGMLNCQQKRIRNAGMLERVQFVQSDALEYCMEPKSFDLVVLPFFLDCFAPTQVEEILSACTEALNGQGYLYFVDFIQPKHGIRAVQASAYSYFMHQLFRWQTGLSNRSLPNFPNALARQRLREITRVDTPPMMSTRLYQKTDSERHEFDSSSNA